LVDEADLARFVGAGDDRPLAAHGQYANERALGDAGGIGLLATEVAVGMAVDPGPGASHSF
jgi:hypothetical protein